jgi:hypothetical protein
MRKACKILLTLALLIAVVAFSTSLPAQSTEPYGLPEQAVQNTDPAGYPEEDIYQEVLALFQSINPYVIGVFSGYHDGFPAIFPIYAEGYDPIVWQGVPEGFVPPEPHLPGDCSDYDFLCCNFVALSEEEQAEWYAQWWADFLPEDRAQIEELCINNPEQFERYLAELEAYGAIYSASVWDCSPGHHNWGSWISGDSNRHVRNCTNFRCTASEAGLCNSSTLRNTGSTSTHATYCSTCGRNMGNRSHSFSHSPSNDSQHRSSCACGFAEFRPHSFSSWMPHNNSQCISTCVCGHQRLRSHSLIFAQNPVHGSFMICMYCGWRQH